MEGTADSIFGGRTTVHEKRTVGGPITAATKKYGLLFYRCNITDTDGWNPLSSTAGPSRREDRPCT